MIATAPSIHYRRGYWLCSGVVTANKALHDFLNCLGEKSAFHQLLPGLGTAKAGPGGSAAPQASQLLRGSPGFQTPPAPGCSKLWWGVLGLCSHPEPVRTWEQPVCHSSPFPVPGHGGKACITWWYSLSVCQVSYLYVFVSEEPYLKTYNCGKMGQGQQTSCLSRFSAGFEFRFLVHFGFMDLLSLLPLLWRSCTLPASK